jgi:acetyl esterase
MSLVKHNTPMLPTPPEPHADMAALLAELALARTGQANRYLVPFPQAREQLLAERLQWLDDGPACDVQVQRIETLEGSVDVQVIRPPRCAGNRVLIYFHGGGWCVGSTRTHEPIVRRLASALQCDAWSVDYRLAPEHPFPAGLLDCVAVIEQVARDHPDANVIVAGDSAGANLALGAAMWLRDRQTTTATEADKVPLPDALLLFYGVYTEALTGTSMAAYGDGRYGLSIAAHKRYMQAYLNQNGKADSSLSQPDEGHAFALSPKVNLSGLPPVFLLAAQIDILRDQTFDMSRALEAAGNQTEVLEMLGVTHGFLSYGKVLSEVENVITQSAAFIRRQVPVKKSDLKIDLKAQS